MNINFHASNEDYRAETESLKFPGSMVSIRVRPNEKIGEIISRLNILRGRPEGTEQ